MKLDDTPMIDFSIQKSMSKDTLFYKNESLPIPIQTVASGGLFQILLGSIKEAFR